MLAACRRLLQPGGGAGWLRRFSSLSESGEGAHQGRRGRQSAAPRAALRRGHLGGCRGQCGRPEASCICQHGAAERGNAAGNRTASRGRRLPPPSPYRSFFARPFLLRPPAAIHETPFGEFIPLSDQAGVPVLVRLHERQWGALARLPAAKLTEAGYEGAHVRAAESHLHGSCHAQTPGSPSVFLAAAVMSQLPGWGVLCCQPLMLRGMVSSAALGSHALPTRPSP